MKNGFHSHHFTDPGGLPSGGHTYGTGFSIAWQSGPLGRGATRVEPNGSFVEDVIGAALDRIEFYQSTCGGKFACDENLAAICHLEAALKMLDARTQRREESGIEGTHAEG